MWDVMDLSGLQKDEIYINSSSLPEASGFAKVIVPSAFPDFFCSFMSHAAQICFQCAPPILTRLSAPPIDDSVNSDDRSSRIMDWVSSRFRCSSPLRNSISAFLVRPLSGPVSRIVFCSSLARIFP